jgi:hypothetical protein
MKKIYSYNLLTKTVLTVFLAAGMGKVWSEERPLPPRPRFEEEKKALPTPPKLILPSELKGFETYKPKLPPRNELQKAPTPTSTQPSIPTNIPETTQQQQTKTSWTTTKPTKSEPSTFGRVNIGGKSLEGPTPPDAADKPFTQPPPLDAGTKATTSAPYSIQDIQHPQIRLLAHENIEKDLNKLGKDEEEVNSQLKEHQIGEKTGKVGEFQETGAKYKEKAELFKQLEAKEAKENPTIKAQINAKIKLSEAEYSTLAAKKLKITEDTYQ